MRRENFNKAVEKYQNQVVKHLVGKGCDIDSSEDAVQNMVMSMLANKSYLKLEGDALNASVCSLLKRAAFSAMKDIIKKEENDNKTIIDIITDSDDMEKASEREGERESDVEVDDSICPFCNEGVLNEYKACGECGTIIGQGKTRRKHISIDEDELQYTPDLDKETDVSRAMATLTEFEQTLMWAVVNKHDTLEGLAMSNGISRPTLDKVYVGAKRKLQLALLEYASEYGSDSSKPMHS